MTKNDRPSESFRVKLEEGRQQVSKGRQGVFGRQGVIERGRQSTGTGIPKADVSGKPLHSQVSPSSSGGSGTSSEGSSGGDR